MYCIQEVFSNINFNMLLNDEIIDCFLKEPKLTREEKQEVETLFKELSEPSVDAYTPAKQVAKEGLSTKKTSVRRRNKK